MAAADRERVVRVRGVLDAFLDRPATVAVQTVVASVGEREARRLPDDVITSPSLGNSPAMAYGDREDLARASVCVLVASGSASTASLLASSWPWRRRRPSPLGSRSSSAARPTSLAAAHLRHQRDAPDPDRSPNRGHDRLTRRGSLRCRSCHSSSCSSSRTPVGVATCQVNDRPSKLSAKPFRSRRRHPGPG